MPGVAMSLALAALALAPLVDGTQLGDKWRVATLPKQTKPVTKFSAETVDERAALRIDADKSYGNVVLDVPLASAPRRLRWSWRVQQPNPAVDLSKKAGDDSPAKVCLSFDVPLDKVPFVDRQVLGFARSQSGEALPTATLCWVWGGREPHGTFIDSPFTRRVRYIVLRNSSDAAGTWFDESRDVAADFVRAFGDESPQVPAVTAVVVGGDSDNTAAHSVAHVSGLRAEP